MNLRDELHGLAERLPEGATWDDVIEHAQYRKAVLEGIAQADRGEFASDERIQQLFAKFGIDTDREHDEAYNGDDKSTPGDNDGRALR